jgi:hypothetical protein
MPVKYFALNVTVKLCIIDFSCRYPFTHLAGHLPLVNMVPKVVCANPAHERGVLNTTLYDKVCQ